MPTVAYVGAQQVVALIALAQPGYVYQGCKLDSLDLGVSAMCTDHLILQGTAHS